MEYELPEEKIPIFNSHFEKGNQLSEGLIIVKGEPNVKFGFSQKRQAKKAIGHYEQCLNLIPNHWQSNWLLAKLYQAMSDHNNALNYFQKALNVERTNPDLPREASITAMDLGNIELALEYSLEAVNREPNDAGLVCNHAVNLMVAENDKDALEWINRAIEMEPNDQININVLSLIKDVSSGQRRRPKFHELN